MVDVLEALFHRRVVGSAGGDHHLAVLLGHDGGGLGKAAAVGADEEVDLIFLNQLGVERLNSVCLALIVVGLHLRH